MSPQAAMARARDDAARDARLLAGVTCLIMFGIPAFMYTQWDFIRFSLFASVPSTTFEAVGMLLIQLVYVWLPIVAETIFYNLHPGAADVARRQPEKSAQQRKEWRTVLGVVLRNQLVAFAVHIMVMVLSMRSTTVIDAPVPSIFVILAQAVLMRVCQNVLFYTVHRVMHRPALYARFHKMHHQFTAPYPLATQYCSLVEHLLANSMPHALPVKVLRPHGVSAWVFISWSLFEATHAHSGYGDPYCNGNHDMHHEFFNCNYGAQWLDDLFGTNAATYLSRQPAAAAATGAEGRVVVEGKARDSLVHRPRVEVYAD